MCSKRIDGFDSLGGCVQGVVDECEAVFRLWSQALRLCGNAVFDTRIFCDTLPTQTTQVMFARVNSPMVEARVPSVLKALKYSQWALAVASEAVGLTDNFTARVTGVSGGLNVWWQAFERKARSGHLFSWIRKLNLSVCACGGHFCTQCNADNAFVKNKGIYKLPRILSAFVRGQGCFDVEFYIEHNRDFFGSKPLKKYKKADLEVR